ncbi:hypothetical protein [Nocardioides dilutus]
MTGETTGVAPHGLLGFGDQYTFPAGPDYVEDVCALSSIRGPALEMRFGLVAMADPLVPSAAPEYGDTSLGGGGTKTTTLTAISRTRVDGSGVDPQCVAAAIGDVDRVASWQPLLSHNDSRSHLEVASGLGAFYEITDASLVWPLFEDDRHMQGIHERALSELVVPIEASGRVVATVFLVSGGAGVHQVWEGFDRDMSAVAMLVDTGILSGGERIQPGGEAVG